MSLVSEPANFFYSSLKKHISDHYANYPTHQECPLEYARERGRSLLSSMKEFVAELEKDLDAHTDRALIPVLLRHSEMLQHIKEIPESVALAGTKNAGWTLEHVENQTEEMCRAAIRQSARAIRFVKNPTPELFEYAVRHHPGSIRHIDNPSEELCLTAIRLNKSALSLIKEPSIEAVKLSCTGWTHAMRDFPDWFDVDRLDDAHEDYPRFTHGDMQDIWEHAIHSLPNAVAYLSDKHEDLQIKAVSIDGLLLERIDNPSEAVCLAAIKQYPKSLSFVRNPSSAFLHKVLNTVPEAVAYVDSSNLGVIAKALRIKGGQLVDRASHVMIEKILRNNHP